MSTDYNIIQDPMSTSTELNQAVDFFRLHNYHLPEITQSNNGLRFATKYWLDPRVKTDKYVFSQVQSVQSKIEWVLYDPSEHKNQVAPPTQPPTNIPEPDSDEWELFDPTPYQDCDVPPTQPPTAVPAPEEHEMSSSVEKIVRYEDKAARKLRELESKNTRTSLGSRFRRSRFKSYQAQEFEQFVRQAVEDILKD